MNRSSMARFALACMGLSPALLLAQEPQVQPPPEVQPPRPIQIDTSEQEAAQAQADDELRELFLKVERNLLRMDQYLLDASAGETSKLDEVGESGIDDLLDQASPESGGAGSSGVARVLDATQARGKSVLEDIDRILEIARQSGSCGSGSCPKPGESGSSPSTDPNQNGQTERMQGNRAPGEKPGGEEPEPRQGENDGDPSGNQDSQEPPSSSPAKRMPEQATEAPPPVVVDADRWGELPIYARDLFRAEGGRDLPPQYRDWIDAYYRRLNKRSGGN